ncbi:hypothetical protein BDY19DRAFT_194128 [Irpex rosettiformis]|uniref:Uncharacterized protein n=1 Tax=Irpex rosettiformis TaxID=378272 RepID=A0ACB8U243_9APHY|nr:hypothetical protein BDY19DRAFT_194128 [Irpex rosettiformis]
MTSTDRQQKKPSKSQKKKKKISEGGPFGHPLDNRPSHLRPPTEDEWRGMGRGKAFVVNNKRFRKGDDVILHDPDNDEENRWLAKIKSIRMRQTLRDGEVWVLVQWYYSAKDMEEIAPNFGMVGMSVHERLMSDREELLNAECFEDITWVYEYREEDPDSIPIPAGTFFQRYCVNTEYGTITPACESWACQCKIPYHISTPQWKMHEAKQARQQFYHENAFHSRTPSPMEVLGDLSHFCPRPECRAWFHELCLARKHTEDETTVSDISRALRLLAVDPDLQVPHPTFSRFIGQSPSGAKTFSSGLPLITRVKALKHGSQINLPDSLIKVAARPIVKRTNCGELSSHGNARDVVLARRLLYQELEGGHEFLIKLLSQLDVGWHESFSAYTHVWQALCVHRLLASPYVRYWDKAVSRRGTEVRAVVCPKCNGAI